MHTIHVNMYENKWRLKSQSRMDLSFCNALHICVSCGWGDERGVIKYFWFVLMVPLIGLLHFYLDGMSELNPVCFLSIFFRTQYVPKKLLVGLPYVCVVRVEEGNYISALSPLKDC